MLVLVTGVTGNLGLHLIDSLSSRGHKFFKIQNYWDVDALDRACNGVDAVICAYAGTPVMHLDAQLLLLRAAERASAKLTSSVKPIWLLTGGLTEVYFSVPGHGNFSPAYNGPWDPENKTVDIWGTGHEKWDLTTEKDAAEFSVAVIERDDIYKEVRDVEITFKERGSLDDLRKLAYSMREQKPYNDYYGFIDLFYQLFQLDGTYSLKNLDNDKFNVKTTSMKEFLRQNPGI
ncbi:hypothetical protein Forpe1208_v009758 [Fusarium oxysporum f. sp. rapae]|uniref:NmrA-like domain-containing protein n=1 Tax=Fusarium oxysporum f. sp. rapae TaxID=485398 RepID=A0A8J5TT85_FUSOX|nr:hypothetical protein Forpe1208_v009758 [Fusarium oxysporum f. sp. rapae]